MEPPTQKSVCLPHDALRDPRGVLFVGGPVAAELLIAKTDDAAIVARHLAAYPDGFSFEFVIRLRERDADLSRCTETLHFNTQRRRDPDNVYLGIELADGRSLSPPSQGQRADEPALFPLGGCTL